MRRFLPSRHWPALLASLALSLPLGLSVDAAKAGETQDMAMRDALKAARAQEFSRIDQAAIDGHVLEGYVDYHRLLSRLPDAPASQVQDFMTRHDDSPLADWMRGEAISRYGKAGRFESLREISDGEPRGTQRRCYYYTALLDTRPQDAADGGRALWRVGHSQPDACDPLFRTLRERGEIGDLETWERLTLAWQAGETGMVSYLGRQLGSAWQPGLDALDRLQQDFSTITQVPTRIGPQGQGTDALFEAAMHGFTRADTEAALEAWRKIAPHLALGAGARRAIEHDLLFYSMVREVANNRGWVDATLPDFHDTDLLKLRVRRALDQRDWSGVIDWVHRMPDEPRREARWQYWIGRALEQLGNPSGAADAFRAAAGDRSFFGFAAADRLEVPYALNLERVSYNAAYRERIAEWPVVQRTEALIRIDEPGLANSEWYTAAARADADKARALADYAAYRGWHARAVQTTIAAGLWDALDWRFPEAYRDDFLQWGNRRGVDPYLLMAIARRESAYNPTVVSPAGARGLMQLMPATARHVSRQLGLEDPGLYGVLQPEINIRLGSRYIQDMIERYRGNRLAATAAYNAGPNRVDRWLKDAPREFDLFVESIPFHETRQYVQAVMAYRVIFESLAKGGNTQDVSLLTQAERSERYDTSLLAQQ
ncbi:MULTISPECIES: transglycosylase SLT domain-containing protein [Halomonadaceae]|jgi:soluble lytic murein transglycosylase|uniref:transglycosylase SLT domain-containing protein n=1 Tax=Halomonadaceae TaxID=28256 RepID=UPI001581CBE5|nr:MULTISPECIES: transglycosylase SLT domain-containing protein [Halomonas]MDI4639243.1 transglycosylase SLT domain-containing protein [Halomonas sp. BMC7]NUJ60234.1 transglycosylase SLT domain-containing protein [Halomonas taeanensis]